MNCLEFRRQLAVDPKTRDAVFLQHKQECPRCAEAYARAMLFEASLAEAMAVPVPENLAERILFAQATEQRKQARVNRGRWIQYAAAAMVLIAIGVVGYSRWDRPVLADLAIAHLAGEPLALTSHAAVPDALVQREFGMRASIAMPNVPSGVTYLSDCPLGPYHIVHMAMAQDNDPVTVMYVADHHQVERKDFNQTGWFGREVPLGAGTLVLLGKSAQSFDHLETVWRDAVNGPRLTGL